MYDTSKLENNLFKIIIIMIIIIMIIIIMKAAELCFPEVHEWWAGTCISVLGTQWVNV